MPRYFFHVMDGKVVIDPEGMVLSDIWEVRKEALRRAAAILSELDNGLLYGGPWSLTVANEDGKTAFSLQFEAHAYD